MKKIICLYGPPGGGKTTQADLLAENFGFSKFGMGERLREEMSSGSKLGKKIRPYVEKGTLIPNELMRKIIIDAEEMASQSGLVFDGFPRMIPQAEMLDELAEKMNVKISAFIYLKLSPEQALNRIKERAIEDPSRNDDIDEEAIKTRFRVFDERSEDLLDFYRYRNQLLEIDGSGTITEIHKEIIESIEL